MDIPRLIALSDSPLVAREIRGIIRSILGKDFPVDMERVADIVAPDPEAIYIAADTQRVRLSGLIPQHQIIFFALRPTMKFFLDVSHVPAGETITIFTSLRPYVDLLQRECHDVGLHGLHFRGIAFSDMPTEDIRSALEKSHYIFGLAPFVSESVLYSPQYRSHIPQDAVIIKVQRTTSVPSASRLVLRLVDDCYHKFYDEYSQLMNADATAAEAPDDADRIIKMQSLIRRYDFFTHRMQRAAMEIIKQQIGLGTPRPLSGTTLLEELPDTLDTLAQIARTQLLTLAYLRDKISAMAKQ